MHRRGHRRQAGVGRRRGAGWEIFTHGGRNATGIDAVAFARQVAALGAGELLVTSMDRDGTKAGYDLALVRAIADAVSVPVIASGGVGTLDHLVDGVRDGHASAVLAASIFHFGTHTHRRGQGPHGQGGAAGCGSTGRRRTSPARKGDRSIQALSRDPDAAIQAEIDMSPSPSPISPGSSPSAPRRRRRNPIRRSSSRTGRSGRPRSSARRRSRPRSRRCRGDRATSPRRRPTCSIISWSCCRARNSVE